MAANSETVEIIIEGTDNSAQAFVSAADSAEKLSTKTAQFGESTRETSIVLRKMLSVMGAGELASWVGQAQKAKDVVANLSETLKDGGKNATMLMKAGLAAAVAFAAFQVGKYFGDMIFQTERWNKELEKAMKNLDEIGKKSVEAFANTFTEEEKIIRFKFKSDPEAMDAELDELRKALNREAGFMKTNLEARKKTLEEAQGLSTRASLYTDDKFTKFRGDNRFSQDKLMEAEAKEIEIEQAKLDALNKQSSALEYQLNSEFSRLQKAEQRAALEAKANQDRANAEGAYWKLVSEQEAAEADRRKKKAEEEEKLATQMGQIAKSAAAEIEAEFDRDWGVIENLKQTNLELTKGEEAAYRMGLETQGLSAAAIEAAVALNQENKALEEAQRYKESIVSNAASIAQQMINDQAKAAPQLQAKESRFLTRGQAGGSDSSKIVKNTEKMKEIAKMALEQAERQAKAAEDLTAAIDFAFQAVSP